MNKRKRLWQRAAVIAGLLMLPLSGLWGVAAQNVTRGYQTDEALRSGMIVRLQSKNGAKIQAATQADEANILGVVVPPKGSAVSLSDVTAEKEIFVADGGRYDVLVSNQNGPIKTGDYITISSLSGVGMKASDAQQYVLGKALAGFDGSSNVESQAELTTSQGKRTVALGKVGLEVSIARNPLFAEDRPAGVPDFLAKMAEVVTDQPVSAFRIYASVGVLLLSLISAGIILFAGVRTGMIAIGRNPLAKKLIFRNLIQVTLMALIVFVIGAIAVYLLLRV